LTTKVAGRNSGEIRYTGIASIATIFVSESVDLLWWVNYIYIHIRHWLLLNWHFMLYLCLFFYCFII